MGITVAYRGQIAELERVADLEDRVVDLALDLGGMAQVWRSSAEQDAGRMVRGLIVTLAPGQEATSLLISPEGWLIGLTDIEDAERAALAEPPWCFVKTQYGRVEGHVALVELLRALRREFLHNLEVEDEAGYWETGDLAALVAVYCQTQALIEGLAESLQRHGLSREAAEDPEIMMQRLQRIAQQVQRTLGRPSEHPPVTFDEDFGAAPDPDRTEAQWDAMYKYQRRMQERMERAIEERLQAGEKYEDAFQNAMQDIGIPAGGEDASWAEDDAEEPSALWQDSLEPADFDDEFFQQQDEAWRAGFEQQGDAEDFADERADDKHPLMQQATELLHRLHASFPDAQPAYERHLHTLFQGAGDVFGGLAQALSASRGIDDEIEFGLRTMQLKRALRGAAFARGALLPLRAVMPDDVFQWLYNTLSELEQSIFHELGRLRSEFGQDEFSGDAD